MRPQVTLRKALQDPHLLGNALPGDSWRSWRTILIAANGEMLTDDERKLFQQLSGREREPLQRVHTLEAVVGRRGGKSKAMATNAAYISGLCDHRDVLVKGEKGVLLCVAPDMRVAGIVRDHCAAAFENSPILRQLIANRTQDTIELTNGISVEVRPASFRKLRGPTYVGVICDEVAFWYQDSSNANPDVEVLAAVRPGLLTTRGPLILASSAYAKSGALYDMWRRHYGPHGDADTLVAYGTSRDFNPSLPQVEIDRALAEDRPRNEAEYLSIWRSDVENFVSLDVVEGCVGDFRELMPARDALYHAFVDPASGSGEDSFTLAIAHKLRDQIIIDCVREVRPHFSPAAAVESLVHTVKSFRCSEVLGDHYAGEFPRELFNKHGIRYKLCKMPKSDLFRDLLPMLNSGSITLPRNDRLIGQIVGLERRVTRAGKDSITHPDHGHDDVANCVAGVATSLRFPTYNFAAFAGDNISDVDSWYYMQLMQHIARYG